ncbi:uncharacterized protein [Pseudorasbora parva]|uniref:uncharacterized protein isoform X2 n=1 Tax=Pseudorasbora parva TaxID=51549 RepID=UPI00351F6DB0
MSQKLQLSHHGHGENDEDSDTPSTRQQQNRGINEITEATITKSKAQDTAAISDIIGMIDTYDRPAGASAEGSYANQGTYTAGKIIQKTGYIAEAGFGRAHVAASIFEAEARGPNASANAEASWLNVKAIGRAEIASASAKAGPLCAKVGLGFDTGASFGVDGVEAKFLGTGISIGPKIGVSVLGSEVSCSVM